MQINSIQSQSINNCNPAFNAQLKLKDAAYFKRFKKMLRYESKHQKDFDLLFERFSNCHKGEVVTMDIVTKQGIENIKINRIGSAVECFIPIKKDGKCLYPISSALKETIENPSFKVMWDV